MRRKQFTFYESFYEAIRCIPVKSQRADAYDAICTYALHGIEPDMERLSPQVRLVMTVCMPVLSAAHKKAEAGRKGGNGGKWQPKQMVPVGSGELGEAEKAAIRKMLAE